MNKGALRAAIVEKLRTDLAQQTAAANLARDEAISEESRPENQYDMHSQEAAYLAEGQARLAKEISENIAQYVGLSLPAFASDAVVSIGALVELSGATGSSWYFVGPRAGGIDVHFEGQTVLVITPQSPLGRALVGKRAAETVRLPGSGALLRIVSVL